MLNTIMASPVNTIIGIDYSYTCPAVCVLTNRLLNTPRWFVNYKKTGKPYPDLPNVEWSISSAETEVQRYLELATWVLGIIDRVQPELIVLEDYAFSANGRITQLSENTGTLKVKLFEHHPQIPLRIVAPTTMKKFATGRGIATKDDIWAAFTKRKPDTASWAAICHPKATRVGSPVADIADAFFLAQYGCIHFTEKNVCQSDLAGTDA